ncbi:MAG: GIY-YIG nuclease family protein [Chromatiales bacterium]|nr:GIY-YIG nuclease family protein [Gammaproteobacteria bacterium]
MSTATIKIFLPHGDPKRLRTAEISNWSGKAVAGPRSEFEGILAREESQQAGVYMLTGIDPERGKPAIYIGEAESIKDRVKAHLAKDFWNQMVFFVSKDENLTKSHIRYLEGRLIEKAIRANRCLVKNSQNSGAKLPESDREDMEVFLEKVYQLLPVLGVELLVAVSSKDGSNKKVPRCSTWVIGLK